uniref:Uncharacterized protein n=1 Tax=Opuntia streptacantha TaxID=393608 RepID=A0A7C9ALD3_OPUST
MIRPKFPFIDIQGFLLIYGSLIEISSMVQDYGKKTVSSCSCSMIGTTDSNNLCQSFCSIINSFLELSFVQCHLGGLQQSPTICRGVYHMLANRYHADNIFFPERVWTIQVIISWNQLNTNLVTKAPEN